MNVSCFKLSVLTSCLCLLTACSQHGILASAPSSTALQSLIPQLDQPQAAKLQLREVDINDAKAEDMQWLSLSTWPEVAGVLTSKNKGLQFLDDEQNVLYQIQGQFEQIAYNNR